MDTESSGNSRASMGDLLRRHRQTAGLTQAELAEQSGLSQRGISDLERGARRLPRRETVALLARALALSASDRARFEGAARQASYAQSCTPPRPSPRGRPRRADASPVQIVLRGDHAGPTGPPLVGRDAELTLLDRHLHGAGPPALLLAGEPGIGKTRLLREVATRARLRGWNVFDGGCHRGGQDPYAPLPHALERHMGSRPPGQQRLDLAGCSWLVRLLPQLVEDAIEPLPGWALSPDQERRLIFRAVERYLTNVSGPAGVLLVLDDLQWAGSDAFDLLVTLIRSTAEVRLRVLGAYRDTEVSPDGALASVLADLAHAGLVEHHTLAPLTPEACSQLLATLLESSKDQQTAVWDRVIRRTGGIPFFVLSCVQDLQVQAARSGMQDAIPWSVAQSVRQRVAALPGDVREVVGTAAVLGRNARSTMLMEVTALREHEALAALEAACRARLLEEGQATYHFTHDIIREVVEADLGLARRSKLHRRAGEALERTVGERPEAWADLALHFLAGEDRDRACHYAIRAGDYAARLRAHTEAAHHYQVALDLLEATRNDREAAAVRHKVGTMLLYLNQPDAARACLSQALADYERLGDAAGQALVHRGIAACYETRFDMPATLRHRVAALTCWPVEQQDADLAHLFLEAATSSVLAGDLASGASFTERGLRLAELLGDAAAQAWALLCTAGVQARLGSTLSPRLALLARAEALARQSPDRSPLFHIFLFRGAFRWYAGDLRASRADTCAAIELAAQVDLPGLEAMAHGNLAGVSLALGDWEAGRAAARTAQALKTAGDSADLLWMEGHYTRALQVLADDLAEAQRYQDIQGTSVAYGALADNHLQLGQVTEALLFARQALDLCRTTGYWGQVADGGGTLAEAAVRAGASDAERLLAEVQAVVDPNGFEIARPALLRAHGLLFQQQGDPAGAFEALQASAAVARAQGALPQLGRTLALLVETAAANGNGVLAWQADAERTEVVRQIGPEVGGLAWARGLLTTGTELC